MKKKHQWSRESFYKKVKNWCIKCVFIWKICMGRLSILMPWWHDGGNQGQIQYVDTSFQVFEGFRIKLLFALAQRTSSTHLNNNHKVSFVFGLLSTQTLHFEVVYYNP